MTVKIVPKKNQPENEKKDENKDSQKKDDLNQIITHDLKDKGTIIDKNKKIPDITLNNKNVDDSLSDNYDEEGILGLVTKKLKTK